MKASLIAVLAALGASSCAGGGDTCCGGTTRAGPGVRYVATLPNPDGGAPTEVEFVLDRTPTSAPGTVTTTFRRGAQEVVETWSAQRRF